MSPDRETVMGKFAIVGTTSSGKTTLTEVYKKRFQANPHVIVLDEGARVFFTTNPDVLNKQVHVIEVQQQIQDFVLQREQEAHHTKAELIICDRSVIDPVVLTQFYGNQDGAQLLLDRVEEWLPTYNKFFLLNPANVQYEHEIFRQETPHERLAIHDTFGNFFVKNNLPFEEISGSVQKRVAVVDRVIYKNIKD